MVLHATEATLLKRLQSRLDASATIQKIHDSRVLNRHLKSDLKSRLKRRL